MNQVTRILTAMEAGDPSAGAQLLPLVYDELRKLAARRLAQEKPGQTLQATALVHEAYLRLVADAPPHDLQWSGRGHFFAAAAEAMRRILVEKARHKKRHKHGGERKRIKLDCAAEIADEPHEDLLDLDEALARLEKADPQAAQIVKLRYFAGLTVLEAAQALGLSGRAVERNWTFARAWLHRELSQLDGGESPSG